MIRFLHREDGGATVEWVVLSALVIGLIMLFVVPFLAAAIGWGEYLATLTPRREW